MYLVERIILISSWVICFVSIWFIPKEKAARASFIFLIVQFFSWILGLTVVEFGLLEYPVRELHKANSTSFSFEFFLLPFITIFFILHYPSNKPVSTKILYSVSITSLFTLLEYLVEKYTLLIEYHSWKWYWTWITMLTLFYISMGVYQWFFKIKIPEKLA